MATGLQRNRFGRRRIREVLLQYSEGALSDGRLIDAARYDICSIDDAIRLLDAHVDLFRARKQNTRNCNWALE